MARELADVLHHFLGDAPLGERLGPASLALLSEPDDAFAVGVAWNLAHELARLGLSVAWVTSLADEELLPPDATPGLTRLLSPTHELGGLSRAVVEAAAKLSASQLPGLVLVRVPPAWISAGAAADRMLGWTLQLSGPEFEQRREALRIAASVLEARRDARVGIALHGVRSIDEAEAAFGACLQEWSEHSRAALTSYGLLLDDAEVYRSLLARRPLALTRPGTRAARALVDVASLLRADFANDAG
jgi:hypothetical protein